MCGALSLHKTLIFSSCPSMRNFGRSRQIHIEIIEMYTKNNPKTQCAPPPNFQKGGGVGLPGPPFFQRWVAGKKVDDFFQGGVGGGCNFSTKNKLISGIFNDKNAVVTKN